ncbi:Hpt domain-containing protein [Algoriphagus pacificus]|uniref:Hpt domain-containing protein n=1 Tax=Algoriphagus pacificus TaxID=2811234 RepID=A0ABS3CKR7_9BACT|nr:Hpt domain-containing protein [Algoriphagus pacificus]MBN7817701.1 Hpt domain-containing protein [Algoriphagus pacificus]
MRPNLQYIKQLANGSEAFENKVLEVVKRELRLEISSFRESLNKGDIENAVLFVHKIKHKVSLLGMEEGYALTAKFEDELREGSDALLGNFESLLRIMTMFLDSINTEK